MEPVVIALGVLPLLIAGVLAFIFLFKDGINVTSFAAQMQKLTMANNIPRALKISLEKKVPFALALQRIYKNANRKHELDLLHEEGVVTLYKYHNFLLLGWLGLLLAAINPALALADAYAVADGGPFIAGLIMSLVAAVACIKLISVHNYNLATGKECLRKLTDLLYSRSSLRRNHGDEEKRTFVPPHLRERELTDEEAEALRREVEELDKSEEKQKKPIKPKAEEPPSYDEPDPPPDTPTRGNRGILDEL